MRPAPEAPVDGSEKLEAEKDALEAEMMPVDFMLRAMRSKDLLYEQRFAAARAAAPYCHPQLQAVAHWFRDTAWAL
jgi:hypothetical protein